METKKNLRLEKKRLLKAMLLDQKQVLDHGVYENLKAMPEFEQVSCVYGYMALSWETGTMEILRDLLDRDIPLALPKVLDDDMEFFQIKSLEDLKEGSFHIPEPDESCEMVHWPNACILVPGLAFSKDGKRLGKGGGYYDKFLSREPEHKTIALAYDFQITEELPSAEHDQPVEYIVTESRIIDVRNKE